MLTAERYVALLNHYSVPNISEPREVEVALGDLTNLFHCTERNVKLIIRKLQEENLIQWSPGRGRGHRSRLIFQVSRESFLLDFAQRLAKKGEYREAFEFLHQQEEDKTVLEYFIHWLNDQFGVEQLTAGESCKDIFRLPVYRSPLTLDPANLFYGSDAHLVCQLFDRLVKYDSDNEQVNPMIAHHWEHNEIATEWTFHLRKGIRFHHGKELMAEDVVFTFNRLHDESVNKWLLSTMDRVEAVDPRTVKVVLKQPNWLLPHLLCSSCASILPSDLLSRDPDGFWNLPSGTGPFRLTHWCNNRMDLDVNPTYFLGRAYLDGVSLVFLPDDIPNSSRLKWEQLIGNDSRLPVKAGRDWQKIEKLCKGCSLITWNRNKKGPHQSLPFRQAVNLMIDRQGMIAFSGKPGYPARSFIPFGDPSLGFYRHDPAAARQLLEESEYGGESIRIVASYADQDDVAWIRNQCATLGIPVEIEYYDKTKMARTADISKEADAILSTLVFANDEVCELESLLHQNSSIHQHMPQELSQWVNGVIYEVLASPSKERRRALLQQIEQRLQEEAQVLLLVHRMLNIYVHPSIKGVAINNLGWIDFKEIWLTSAQPTV